MWQIKSEQNQRPQPLRIFLELATEPIHPGSRSGIPARNRSGKQPNDTRSRATLSILIASFILLLIQPADAWSQQIRPAGRFQIKGTVQLVRAGELSIKDEKGKTAPYKIQDRDEEAISLEGSIRFSMPAKIQVNGRLPAALIERGMILEFDGRVNRQGKTENEISQIKVIQGDASDLTIDVPNEPVKSEYADCHVIGRVVTFNRGKLRLAVPKSRYGKQERIIFRVANDATIEVKDDSLNQVVVGDQVVSASGVKLSNGDQIIQAVSINMTADREKATLSVDDQLNQKYSELSDEPSPFPRSKRSDHFILLTDISDRSASVLLAKLERMYALVGRYYAQKPREPIVCYVVRDLNPNKWKGEFRITDPAGVAKIQEGAGVTRTRSLGKTTRSVVYSTDKHNVVQHEAVHAFCSMAFGSAGPVWYAEGMAELGQYWKEGELAVNIEPLVIDYLTHDTPKKLKDIVAPGQVTGDSWKAYAWRWALCHMLAHNSNYSKRFKRLGMNMMAEPKSDSFNNAFGVVAPQISFEYDQFVKNFGNGYRADLCSWDWKTQSKKVSTNLVKGMFQANAGWQATKLEVEQGVTYDFTTRGEWQTGSSELPVTADGKDGKGQLQGVIFYDFNLTKPFPLGTRGKFTAPVNGQLFVRCQDKWTELGDNSGEIALFLRRTKKAKTAGTSNSK